MKRGFISGLAATSLSLMLLAACSAPISTSSSSGATSSSPSTGTETTSSSESPSSSSSSSSSSSTSSTLEANMVTKTLDLTTMVVSSTDSDECTDGFFALYGGSVDTTKKVMKTGGTSDIRNSSESKQHYLSFTTAGAGTLSLTSKSGSTASRKICVAEADSAATLNYDVIAMAMDNYSSDGGYTGD